GEGRHAQVGGHARARRPGRARAHLGPPWSPVLARISARCMVVTRALPSGVFPAREAERRRVPPMCIRQELSAAHSTSAPVASTAAHLSAAMAADTSGVFPLNVPPK